MSRASRISGGEQLRVQGAQFGAGVGTEAIRQQPAELVVRGQRLSGAARLAQRAQPQGLEGLVQRVGVAQGGEFGQRPLGLAEGDRGGVPGAHRVEAAGLPAGRLGGAVGQVGEGRPCHRARASSRTTAALAGSPSASARIPSPVSRSKRCRSTSSGAAASR